MGVTPPHIRSPVPVTQNLKVRKKAGQCLMTEEKILGFLDSSFSCWAIQGREAAERRQATGGWRGGALGPRERAGQRNSQGHQ